MTCEDANGCTIDSCVEATKSCKHVLRDADGDGDPDDHCDPGHDCDDTNPNVNSKHVEVCNNGIDDNCNGQIDEQPCVVPTNDTCAAAQTVSASSSLLLTTVAANEDYATSCATNISGGQDIVIAITVPPGAAQNLALRAKAETADVAITLESACGATASEIQCINLRQADTRAIAYSVAGGTTIYAILTTSTESALTFDVSFEAATPPPANEDCSAPQAIALNTAVPVSLVGVKRDLDSTCASTIGDLTYAFTLTQPQDVKIFASTTLGSGDPIVSLRGTDCANQDETTCHAGDVLPLFRRSLPAGTYVIAVSGTGQIDENIVVQTSPATIGPNDQFCGSAPAIEGVNQTVPIDLTDHEGIIDPDCDVTSARRRSDRGAHTAAPGGERRPRRRPLRAGRHRPHRPHERRVHRARHDLLRRAERLRSASHGTASRRTNTRSSSPTRSARRRPSPRSCGPRSKRRASTKQTRAPTPSPIPETGGYFTGDTSKHNADFNAGCDDVGQPVGGAKDQLLKLVLSKQERVIFDMTNSQYTTLLDLRTGDPCPGTEVQNGCVRPQNGQYSFLDVTLDPGTYYVQIDGVGATSAGVWFLDVRVIDP